VSASEIESVLQEHPAKSKVGKLLRREIRDEEQRRKETR